MNQAEIESLSKTMAFALRHRPDEFGLVLDSEGWTPISDLLSGLNRHFRGRRTVSEGDIRFIVAQDAKGRYELAEDRIRAVYGHSLEQRIKKIPSDPPEILYHGTTPAAINAIMADGLKPMGRQYVHLTEDVAIAHGAAFRRTQTPIILAVKAAEAFRNGIHFYAEGNAIWLSDPIPPIYLSVTRPQ